MTDPSSYPVRLATDIARLLKTLDDYLYQATPREAAEVLCAVLAPEDGLLARVTGLVGTGSQFAQDQAHHGMLPPEAWLAMGRAANELADVGRDLDEHADALKQLAEPPAPARTAPPTPIASAMVIRRSR
ncbi:hypothetical protein [Streptomyces sp. MNP-20]|uniref:hypothetical protein n=1 Tax=Streptomyces sp. MNP-20 TaxID=2721165 RepID=UPI001553C9DC|nr:hypothetical protein [Streptomyces sp. MNP-20]